MVSAEMLNTRTPSITIVIPCWNAERWIHRAILSVLGQGYPNLEVIVVDDGSVDASLKIIQSFGNDIQWHTGPNCGACNARNRGLELARSQYVLFLDADDYIEPGSLPAWGRRAVRAGADLVIGPFAYERNGTRSAGLSPPQPANPPIVLRNWLEGWFTPPCSMLWRRTFLISVGGWNPAARLSRSDDGELAMRAMLSDPRIAIANEGLGVYVQHDSPNRKSRLVNCAVLRCEAALLNGLWEIAQARGYGEARSSFAKAFYRIAYDAFATGAIGVGNDSLSMARKLGLRGHIGSVTHRVSASVLGLRKKMLLSGILKGRNMLHEESRRAATTRRKDANL
jgi:glycosyltransferase involved in cell wall biosynthesis